MQIFTVTIKIPHKVKLQSLITNMIINKSIHSNLVKKLHCKHGQY